MTLYGIVLWLMSLLMPAYQASVSPIRDPVISPIVSPTIPAPTARPFWGLTFTDDLVTIPQSAFQFGTGSFTVEVWWKPLSTNLTDPIRIYTSPMFLYLGHRASAGLVRFEMNLTDSDTVDTGLRASNYVYSVGTWYHIALVCDRTANKIYLYVNGVAVVNGVAYTPTGHFNFTGVGYMCQSYTQPGVGSQVRFWTVGRTQVQVIADMVTPFYGPTAGLVLEYPMIPGSGQTITDYSGTGNTGTLGATTAVSTDDPAWIGLYTRLTTAGVQ